MLCYKQIVNAIVCTIELWMQLGGLLSTQEARVALSYHLLQLLHLFSKLLHASITQKCMLGHLPFVK